MPRSTATPHIVRTPPAGGPALSPPEGGVPPEEPAKSLQALAEQAASCTACPLHRLGTQTVFGEGAADAALMLVGEQPGDHEDQQGRPFVGPAGQLLERALAQLQWPRERLYVTNAVKHFKYEWRGTRRMHKTPAQREVMACNPWLQQEITLVQPQAIVALGATALKAVMGSAVGVLEHRGRWLKRPQDGLPVLVTLHPSALLRYRGNDRDAQLRLWLDDLRQASGYMKGD